MAILRHFLELSDLTATETRLLINRAIETKRERSHGRLVTRLPGKTLALVFEKSSTRTRVSFEVGMGDLGGRSLFLSPADIQLGRGESIKDTVKVLSRMCHGIVLRTHDHSRLAEFAHHASVPVINGLTDLLHPVQILADLMTIQEHLGSFEGIKVAYIGDGNNVANSWIEACALFNFQLAVAHPPGYGPDPAFLKHVGAKCGDRLKIVQDPKAAAQGAKVLYTDTWTSMGQEKEAEIRRHAFQGYQINRALINAADPGVKVMHCLPAHWGEEIADDLQDAPELVIFDEAENRLHAQKELLVLLMG